MIAFTEGQIIYGAGPVRPITNVPEGVLKVRIRQRCDCITTVFLKFKDRIEQWHITPDGENWRLDYPVARNAAPCP